MLLQGPHLAASLIIVGLIAPLPAQAKSSFRLVSLGVDGQDVVVSVALHNEHAPGTVVDLFAHPQPAIWSQSPPGAVKVREGLLIDSRKPEAGDSTMTVRVPLAQLKDRGIDVGGKLYLVGNWVTSENNGGGHDWGSLAGVTGGHDTTSGEIARNSALARRCLRRGPFSPRFGSRTGGWRKATRVFDAHRSRGWTPARPPWLVPTGRR